MFILGGLYQNTLQKWHHAIYNYSSQIAAIIISLCDPETISTKKHPCLITFIKAGSSFIELFS